MPEPEETVTEVAQPPTPPLQTSSSRASFASCPPEDDRETQSQAQAQRAARRRTRGSSELIRRAFDEESRGVTGEASGEGYTQTSQNGRLEGPQQQPTPETEVEGDARSGVQREREDDGKAMLGDDAVMSEDSAVASPQAQEEQHRSEELRMPNSEAQDTEVDEDSSPLYMSCPRPLDREKPHPQAWSSFLHPGSKFIGTQQSDRQVYEVQVEIKDVDLTESRLCGYLRIKGLTDDHPTLTTFFEGEIIGPRYLFRTTHPTWNSSEKIDLQHWARFPAFRPLAKAARANPTTFTLKNHLDREHLFMRWKEYFLVPDHRVKSISGASFEGFYYICFDQVGGGVSGIYFHARSEKYQQLELKHVPDGGCVGAMEFR